MTVKKWRKFSSFVIYSYLKKVYLQQLNGMLGERGTIC